jgi:phosphotransferase system, enzyme I, PtsP
MGAERNRMRKKTFDLLCNVGELTGLFQKSTNIKGLLHLTVKIISRHMQTEACSIFLLEESSNTLILRATVGLNPEMIGKLRLQIGEGITGTSLKELKPICVPRGSEDPNFKYVQGIFEEKYESFLAVPILQSSKKLGVIVLEDSRPDYYNKRDIRALSAIASQLATFLEHARMLIELRNTTKRKEKSQDQSDTTQRFFRGRPTSSGITMGQAVLVSGSADDNLLMHVGNETYRSGETAFDEALKSTTDQLKEIQSHLDERLSEAGSLIFGSHLLMLSDEEFSGSMRTRIKNGSSAAEAIVEVVNEYVKLFLNTANANTQDKIHDVKDLGHRLLKNLAGDNVEDGDYSGQIVVARNLLPSEIVKLAAQHTEGFVVYGAGETSHISILARSLEVPTVLLTENEFYRSVDGKFLILDAYQGTLIIEPESELIDRYVALEEEMSAQNKHQEQVENPTTICSSLDGSEIVLLANVNLLSDTKSARKAGTSGVGLYRSEYLFLVRNDFPPEEEQLLIYKKLITEMDPIYFRTLDIGGDKMLSAANIGREENPFMGLRAIRYSFKNVGVLKAQLRALLRAGAHIDLNIMFPLISGLDDFLKAKEIARTAKQELSREKLIYNAQPRFGAMIELPSAVSMVRDIAREADFLSIGSNDLVQYILGVDRTNENVADLYSVYHPAVLRAFKQIAYAGQEEDCLISVCGDAVSDPAMLTFFIGIGIRSYSVDPRMIYKVRGHISALNISEAADHAVKMLSFSTNQEVTEYIDTYLQ